MTLSVEHAPHETGLESGGHVKGLAIAVVTKNKDDDGMGRVKVRYPWHDKPRESYWARMGTPMAGKDRGFVAIPEIGDEVIVGFERGDLRFPCVVACVHNGKDTTPFPNKDGKNDVRMFRSRKKHMLRFDDGDKGVVELTHEKGRKVIFDDDGFAVQDEKGNVVKVDSNSGAMTIEAKGTLSIKANKISIEAPSIDIKASGIANLKGGTVNIN